jgi:hypothetical protein
VIVDVAGDQNRIDVLVRGDADHLGERVGELGDPRPAPDGPPHVPVPGVQQPHEPTLPRGSDKNHMLVICFSFSHARAVASSEADL